jgi:predicted NBD/HSP70 family sugar kinase
MSGTQIKADSDLMRRQNRGLVLEALRKAGPSARVELGRHTDLSPATITSITSDLIAEGLIQEGGGVENLRPGPGRPQVRLELNPDAGNVLGLRISIGRLDLILARYDGSIVARSHTALNTWGSQPGDYSAKLAKAAVDFLAAQNVSTGKILRAGIAVQGIADARNGTIAWSPAFDSRNIPVRAALEEALGAGVLVANDSNLMARVLAGTNGDARNTLVVFIGYGVGMGIILEGKVYDGPTGAAAEFGHMNHVPGGLPCRCGRKGCIEAYAADYAILRSYRGEAAGDELPHDAVDSATMADLVERADDGEPRALHAYREAGLALGYGLGRAIAMLDVRHIVVAGPGVRAFDYLKPGIDEGLASGLPAALAEGITITPVAADQDMIADGLLTQLYLDLDRELLGRQARISRTAS